MWPTRGDEHKRIIAELGAAKREQGLLGLPDGETVDTLAWQFIASIRREDYYKAVQMKPVSRERADPNNPSFDAERAVAFHVAEGNIDEAGWLAFLMTHFARRPDTGWLRLRDVYGRLGGGVWDWPSVTADPSEFYRWLNANWQNVRGAFGNHRKYESMRPTANRPMSQAVGDYIEWIGPGGHASFFANVVRVSGNDPGIIFDYLYQRLDITSFGRLAKFDFLSLIGRYGIAPIKAGSAYLDGATGPGRGARLLIDGEPESARRNATLQIELDVLDRRLEVGMEVMEDALCNWQKSPKRFIHYKG